jgi:hypothetical protein
MDVEGWLATAVRSLGSLPADAVASMEQLRVYDAESRAEALAIQKEETALLEELKQNIKEGKKFDEAEMKARGAVLNDRRAEVVKSMDRQIKLSESFYEKLDGAITSLDKNVNGLNALFSLNGNQEGSDIPGEGVVKKKGSKNQPFSINLGLSEIVDPDGPIYCFCQSRNNTSLMIGCDSETCKIEWFHKTCVGFSEDSELPETWYCPDCRKKDDDV